MILDAFFSPNMLLESEAPERVAIVVIDTLRATTTIARALAVGAEKIIPALTIEEALAHRRPTTIVCGERGGLRPDGFDLGNSPLEFTAESVAGRSIAIMAGHRSRTSSQQAPSSIESRLCSTELCERATERRSLAPCLAMQLRTLR